jgi:hypothetical protein
MLELHVANTDVTGGSVAVTWCVDQELLKELAEAGTTDPQIIIVVSSTENYHVKKEYRKVVGLKDLMTYVEFRSSGKNKIWAFVSHGKKNDVKSKYLSRDNGEFSTSVLDHAGEKYDARLSSYDKQLSIPLEVNVPAGVFAKSPPKWEQTWVNHWFRNKPIDQCDYRKRRLVAYTAQPVVFALSALLRTLFLLVSTLWLSRGMKCLAYVNHLLSNDFFEACNVFKGGSFGIPQLPEDNDGSDITLSYVLRKVWKIPLMPAVFIPVALICYFHVVLLALITVFAIILLLVLGIFITTGGLMASLRAIAQWWDSLHEDQPLWYLDRDEIELITCNPNTQKRRTLADLPVKRRTVWLRIQDLKSKICRPFSA